MVSKNHSELIRNDFRSIPKAMFIFKRSYIEEYFPIPKSLPFEDLWINFIASKAKDLKYKNKSFYVYRQHSNQFMDHTRTSIIVKE